MKMYRKVLLALSALALSASLHAADKALIDQGRYLVKVAGCNDCHSPGYMATAGDVPEADWLTGESFGWRGPWGTTYATNLRLSLQRFTEDEWLEYAKNLRARPPMPWFSLNVMKDRDLKAIYQYVRHMGPAGSPSVAYLPPGEEPKPPYALFP